MKHLGDITKINGAEIEPVDCITAGSPCQDLSVAGRRAGLEGERSGLFMEQIRIIKEMRKADEERGRSDEYIRPRYMVWENVPGAFSSNEGEDFRCVLEETARVVQKDAVIPRPPKCGRWQNGGCIMGDGWSIAWKLHDAQFWGVPQRRKRIALVADFGGHSAPEILFVRKGLSRDTDPRKQKREETSSSVGGSSDSTSYTLKVRGGVEIDSSGKRAGKGALVQTEKSGTLGASQDQTLITLEDNGVCYGIDQQGGKGGANYATDIAPPLAGDSHGTPHAVAIENHPSDSRVRISGGVVQTLSGRMGTGGNNVPLVMKTHDGENNNG